MDIETQSSNGHLNKLRPAQAITISKVRRLNINAVTILVSLL
jgi:hypothetical protein